MFFFAQGLIYIRQRLYRGNRATSETIARILQPHIIRVAHKPITNLRRRITNVKDKRQTGGQTGSSLQDKNLQLPGYLHW